MLKKSVFAATILMAATSSYADVNGGAYAGVGVGSSAFNFDSVNMTETKGDKRGNAQKVYGGYRFTPNWGVEIGYQDAGKVEKSYSVGTFKGKASSAYIAGTGRLPVSDKFAFTGKLALTSSRIKADGAASNIADFKDFKGSQTNFVLGSLGAEYAITPNVSTSLDLDGLGKLSKKVDGATVTANLKYHF